jgi:predicted HicB family RNase H-like nuclease
MAMSQKEKTDYKRKFNESKYDRIGLYLFPEDKKAWQEAADREGVSLSEFIKKCVNERLER